MELLQYLSIARRWWWLLLVGTALGVGLAYGISTLVSPTYRATATLLVSQQQTPGVVQLNDLQASERLANTFSRLARLRPVLDRAIHDAPLAMSADDLAKQVSVSNPRSTQLLEVSATAHQPGDAAIIANSVAQAFIATNDEAVSTRPGTVTIVEAAEAPDRPVSPRRIVNGVLGGVLALAVIAGLLLLVESLDDTLKDATDVEQATALTALGMIDQFSRVRSPADQLQAAIFPRSLVAEEYRAVRTALANTLELARGGRVLLVSSPGPSEGKTTTLANLAVVFGMTGRRVVAVDTDLRRPTLHRVFGLRNTVGLTNLLLTADADVSRVLQRTAYHNVSVLTAGAIPANPSELVGSGRTARVIDQLRQQFDLVLLDSPPVLAVTDASVLGALADTVVLVVRPGQTRRSALRAAVQSLVQSGRSVSGVVLNRAQRGHRGYYSYYRYGYGAHEGARTDDEAAGSVSVLRADSPPVPTGDRGRAGDRGDVASGIGGGAPRV